MWVTKLLISPVKKKDFLSKNDQIWPKIGIFGQFGPAMQAYSVPCWWVGWWLWRAGCISQDTYLLYDIFLPSIFDRARNKVICGEWNLIRRDCGRYFQKVYFSQLFTELDKKQGAESFHQYTSLTCCLVHSASFRIQ